LPIATPLLDVAVLVAYAVAGVSLAVFLINRRLMK
jgi:hypothetical protein